MANRFGIILFAGFILVTSGGAYDMEEESGPAPNFAISITSANGRWNPMPYETSGDPLQAYHSRVWRLHAVQQPIIADTKSGTYNGAGIAAGEYYQFYGWRLQTAGYSYQAGLYQPPAQVDFINSQVVVF